MRAPEIRSLEIAAMFGNLAGGNTFDRTCDALVGRHESDLERLREWRRDNPEKSALTSKRWREANPERMAALRKKSHEKSKLERDIKAAYEMGCHRRRLREAGLL